MSASVSFDLPVPSGLSGFKLPAGVRKRLDSLLDRQDAGMLLTAAEKREAEGLVEMAEFLTLLKLRSARAKRGGA